ncbi:MAG TPA: CHASE2 domain-containing protein [Stellaceae bacterium]|nr:CHASE2 domain-containing protein [Stellaceae bacterium]
MSSEPEGSQLARSEGLRALITLPGLFQALVLFVILLVLPEIFPASFEELALRSFDLEQRIAPRPEETLPVVIVAIDEASLSGPNGQWPWPRSAMAELVRKIASGHPLALGVDILFAERDRLAPQNLAAELKNLPETAKSALATLPDNDAELGAAFKMAPTVLGLAPSFEKEGEGGSPIRAAPIRAIGPDPQRFLDSFPGAVRSLPVITAGETGAAALTGNPDRDGIVRRVPLVVSVAGTLMPSLALETLRVASGARGMAVLSTPSGVEGVRVANTLLPTDGEGRAYPYFARPQSATTISAGDVFSDSFDVHAFTDQIVLLGVTGVGLVDIKETPTGLMQGVEVHAQLIESVLSDQILRRPAAMRRIERGLVAAAALIVILFIPYRRPFVAAGLVLVLAALFLGGAFAVFRYEQYLVNGVYPAVVSVLVFTTMLSANLRLAEEDRRRLAGDLEREREAKARIEGELNAARSIQMGLLPKPLPRVPDTRSVDVHQLLETARTVGGDLYDFIMLDQRRLYFAIADVSGKGVDAALFMAMTKMALSGATLHYGDALDRVFGDANSQISEASDHVRHQGGRPMFVTVFAAVLELDTGIISYASGGHDSPYLLRQGVSPARLLTDGGPPLGTMDEFMFPVDRTRLAPGDMIVLYTDGVTEAKDEAGAFYTSARLDKLMESLRPRSARGVVDAVREDVWRFMGDADQADDVTLLVVHWLGPEPPASLSEP